MALRPKRLESGDRLVARSVLWLALALYTLTFGGGPGDLDRDGALQFQATRALVHGDGLRISDETPEGATLLAEGDRVRVVAGRPGAVARVEPLHAITGVPFYLLGAQVARVFDGIEELDRESAPGFAGGRSDYWSRVLVGWRGPLFAALASWLVCLSCLRLGASRPAAWIGSMLLVTTTFLWPAASSWTPTASTALAAAFTLYALLRIRDRFWDLRAPGPWHWIWLGFGLGAFVASQPVAAPIALLLVISAVRMSVRGRKRLWSMPLLEGEAGVRRSVLDVALLLAPVLGFAALVVWGAVLRADAVGEPWSRRGWFAADADSNWIAELAGVLAAPGKGLVWLAPCLLVAVFGYARLRREPRLLTFTAAAPLLGLLSAALWGGWSDLDAFEPLGLAPVLVLAWPAVVLGLDLVREHPRLRWATALLAVVGLIANAGGLLASRGTYRSVGEQVAAPLFGIELHAAPGATDPATLGRLERRLAWDWRTAAPWVGWRLVRHRLAAQQGAFAAEVFPSEQIVLEPGLGRLAPEAPRDRGFSHLAWVDLEERLDGRVWPVLLLVLLGLGAGGVSAAAGLDPTHP